MFKFVAGLTELRAPSELEQALSQTKCVCPTGKHCLCTHTLYKIYIKLPCRAPLPFERALSQTKCVCPTVKHCLCTHILHRVIRLTLPCVIQHLCMSSCSTRDKPKHNIHLQICLFIFLPVVEKRHFCAGCVAGAT